MPVLKTLKRRKIKFIMPIPVRGKSGGVRKLFEASTSHKTTYTFNSPKHGELEVFAVVVKKYSKGRYKRKGVRWFAYAVAGLPKSVEPHQVFEMYRQRFGIETSYRQMNQVRARTTSRNPVIRLLLVAEGGFYSIQPLHCQPSEFCNLPQKSCQAFFQILVDPTPLSTHARSCS